MEIETIDITSFDGKITEVVERLDYSEEVERGAAWLDKTVGPLWHLKVNIPALDMSCGDTCILGQVFLDEMKASLGSWDASTWEDGFTYASRQYFQEEEEESLVADYDAVIAHGFDVASEHTRLMGNSPRAYEFLAHDWISLISERLAQGETWVKS